MTQKSLGLKIDANNLGLLKDRLTQEAGEREIAHLGSLGLPYAGAWLNAPPIPALGLHLRSNEFILAVKYRLGCYVYDREGPCPACLRPSDRFGDHSMCCGSQGERISRHNHLRDALFSTAAAAALSPVKESRFLLPGADRRPADVLIPNWSRGRDMALDVTVVNPLQAATLTGAATNPGHALSYAYDRKMRGAAEDCRQQGIAFLPLVVESLGGWHGEAVGEIKKLASALSRHVGQDEEEAGAHLFTRLSILLQKGNAAILANRVPSFPEPTINGIE